MCVTRSKNVPNISFLACSDLCLYQTLLNIQRKVLKTYSDTDLEPTMPNIKLVPTIS